MTEVIKSIMGSGLTGIAIALTGLLAAIIIVERWRFFSSSVGKSFNFFRIISENVAKGDISSAIAACDAHPSLPSSVVTKEILIRADRDDASMEAGLEIGLSKLEPMINKRVDFIPTLANISTLLGLLGTIIGLIVTFASFSNGDAAGGKEALTAGISLAMSTTALGLVVAIPITFLGSMIEGKRDRSVSLYKEKLEDILDQLKNRHLNQKSS
jgi:biopolymer transport protein ExbB/TolQ